jgi:hypothetical protein
VNRWHPDVIVTDLVLRYGGEIRNLQVSYLMLKSQLWTKPRLLGGMAGITFHKDKVLFDEDVKTWPATKQAGIILHELVHVAQQLTLPNGWAGFMATYAWEWVRSGFSYKRMCKIGLEEEAYRLQARFLASIESDIARC